MCSASASGSASRRVRSSAGTPVRLARISGGRSRNRFSRSGARSPRSRTVGPRSSAGPFRSFTSGCVEREKSSSRAIVALLSSRKVGKIEKVSASASSRDAVASKVCFEFTISSWSAPWRSLIAPNTRPVFLIRWWTAWSCSSSTCINFAPSTAKPSKLPNASLRSSLRWPFVMAPSSSLTQSLKAWRVSGSKAVKISSSSVVSSAWAFGSRSPSSKHAGALVPGCELEVGLAEQRLLPEDRLRVLRDRGVLLVELDLDDRARTALVELLRLDLSDVHARHPDVGLLGERRRLLHVHREAVALGVERHRAAEREPEEDQDREHRERERDHRDHAADAGGLLDHGAAHAPSAPKSFPMPSASAGGRPASLRPCVKTPQFRFTR